MTASTSHPSTTLSPADELIITQVFDPESSPDTSQIKIDPSLPADPQILDPALLQQLQKRELEAIRLVENYTTTTAAAVAGADQPASPTPKHAVFAQALALLASLLAEHPRYASAYNNRAQLRRWHASDAATQQLALRDLDTAIKLASASRADGAVSPRQARLLAAAWTQRGAVFWGLGQRHLGSSDEERMGEDQELEWAGWDSVRLEEEGSRCFFMAGLYGSEIGRTMAVKTNPYARLCGGIVREAMKREGAVGC